MIIYPVLTQLIYEAPKHNLVKTTVVTDITLLLILAQIEYKLGNSEPCNYLCDLIISQAPTNMHALEMKGDICKHFC